MLVLVNHNYQIKTFSHNYPSLDSKSNNYKASPTKNFQPKFAHQDNENISNQLTKHIEK